MASASRETTGCSPAAVVLFAQLLGSKKVRVEPSKSAIHNSGLQRDSARRADPEREHATTGLFHPVMLLPNCCTNLLFMPSSSPILGYRYCGDAFVPPLPLCCHAFRLCITFHPCEGVATPSLSASVTSAQLQIGTPRPGAAPAPAPGRLCCGARRHLSATTRPCGALMVRITPKTPPNQTPACAAQCRLCGCQSNLNLQQQASLTSVHLILLQATARSLAPRAVSKTTRLQRESRRTKQTRPRKLLPQICRCACRLMSSFFVSNQQSALCDPHWVTTLLI